MADRTLVVKVVGDSRQFQREMSKSAKSAKGFEAQVTGIGRSAAKVGAGVGIAFGGRALIQQMFRSIQAASDLNEEITKSEVVFDQSAKSVLDWSRTTADAFGISQRAALGAAAGFGQILQTSGQTEEASARMSRDLVELAGDMASFNNITVDESLLKLRAGLAGEAEPLRVLGVQLSEARVKQEAYNAGIAESGAVLTEAQKVQGRYNLIFKDTIKQQGDADRTSGSLANKQRVLNAKTEELNASLGELGLTVLPTVVDGLIKTSNAATGTITGIQALRAAIRGLDIKDPTEGFFVGLGKRLREISNLPGIKQLREQVRGLAADGDAANASYTELAKTFSSLSLLKPKTGSVLDKAPSFGEEGFKPGGAPPVPLGMSAEQRNRIFDQMIGRKEDRVQDVKSLEGQLKALDRIALLITAQIDKVKDITRKLNLRDELLRVRRQQRGIREQIQDIREQDAAERVERERLAKEEARRKRELAQQARIAKLAAQQARQLAALEEPVAGIGALRRRLKSIREQVEGTPLDTDKTTAQLKRIAKVLSGSFGAVGKDVRSAIQQMFRDINDALNEGDKAVGPATKSKLLDVSKVLKGLSGTPEALAAARNALAGAVAPVRTPVAAAVAAGAGGGQVFAIENLYVNANNADELMRDLQRRTQRKSTTRRG